MNMEINMELLDFIEKCPSSFHTVLTIAGILSEMGYIRLNEGEKWSLKEGENYFVTRNNSSIIAFKVPAKSYKGFLITASHGDAPAFKVKPEPELLTEGCYVKLNTEKYGGGIHSSWLDRPLSIAGRITVKTDKGIETRLINIDKDLLLIPSLAIHMNREVNKGVELNAQIDMLPLFGDETAKEGFLATIAETGKTQPDAILGGDLLIYCRSKGTLWGKNREYISSPRLDDLQCAFGTLKGFLNSDTKGSLPVYCVLDNEEVGSGTKQGAKSTFLNDVLKRISYALEKTEEEYLCALSSSFMISADNGHAVHPNHPEKADPNCRPKMNGGILLKYNANQKYTTDAVSEAIVRQICQKAGVPVQEYVNRSDVAGGSTLGNLAVESVSINCADIGLAQLSMHSAYETAGSYDTEYLIKMTTEFYSSSITALNDGDYEIK
ncbi:MAG: M18 family aminopeptidase [Clostridia bacterium]|nr:M18 family aminopeptidase [Clostridia bacterium]